MLSRHKKTLKRWCKDLAEAYRCQLKQGHAALKSKYDSVKARNTILSREIKELKEQMSLMRSALDGNEEVIEQLQCELEEVSNQHSQRMQPQEPVHVDSNALQALQK